MGQAAGDQHKRLLSSFSFRHRHHHHHGAYTSKDVPKGCLAIRVGEEQLERFVVPVKYFNHPLFERFLKAAEEVYGFDQKGTITIPCCVEEFRYVQGLIDKEMTGRGGFYYGHGQSHLHLRPIEGCFRA